MFYFNFGYDLIIFLFIITSLTFLLLCCKLLCRCCQKSRTRNGYHDLSYESSQVIATRPVIPSYTVVSNPMAPYQNPGGEWVDGTGVPFKPRTAYAGYPGTSGNLPPPHRPQHPPQYYYNASAAPLALGPEGQPQSQQQQQEPNFMGYEVPSYLDPPPAYSSIREFQQQRLQNIEEGDAAAAVLPTQQIANAPRLED